MELQCKVQNYEWGKQGLNSKVANLLASADPSVTIEPDKHYAELWMGTHSNGPSLIIERGVLLSEYIQNNHDAIGPEVKKKFGIQVPFLLKVLSIEKALSIQAHPSKEHAEQLHQSCPERYTDSNHKPELSIALTPFEALCGFRLLPQIQSYLSKLPELTEILPQDAVNAILAHEEQGNSNKVLKQVVQGLMLCDKTAIANSLKSLVTRLENEGQTIELGTHLDLISFVVEVNNQDPETQSTLLYPLIRRLHQDYPGDLGCFAPYFMNYMQLRPGQAIFLKSNLPHAYISGDCVECMACSDNVVRAGLTPKPVDIETLIEMLDYSSYAQEQLLFNPHMEDVNCCIWRPPVPDFAIVKIRVESDGDPYNSIIRASPSLILIISGSGEVCDTLPITAKPGVVVFLKASRQLTITPSPGDHIEAYQAICNV